MVQSAQEHLVGDDENGAVSGGKGVETLTGSRGPLSQLAF